MDEKKETEEKPTEEKTEESTEQATGGKATEANPLDEAKDINKKKEELLEREEKLLERKEKLHAVQMVGGRSQAGQTPAEETEDDKWAKGVTERYEGTGMSPLPDKTEQ